eukprot:COSAG06_NODE_37393_length_435_cov_1.886905_1_plen_56_part_01
MDLLVRISHAADTTGAEVDLIRQAETWAGAETCPTPEKAPWAVVRNAQSHTAHATP